MGRQEIIYDETTDYSQPGIAREFISRHTIDGKFTFVDQRSVKIDDNNCSVLNLLESLVINISVNKPFFGFL